MDGVIAVFVSLVLTVVTIAFAMSHNRPFDVFTGGSDRRRWWLCQFGINTERRR